MYDISMTIKKKMLVYKGKDEINMKFYLTNPSLINIILTNGTDWSVLKEN